MYLFGGVVGTFEKGRVGQLINESTVVVLDDGFDEPEACQPAGGEDEGF
jgi:hypothetical protein